MIKIAKLLQLVLRDVRKGSEIVLPRYGRYL